MVTAGVVPSQEMRRWIGTSIVSTMDDVEEDQIQPASFDVRVADRIFPLHGLFRPRRDEKVADFLESSDIAREGVTFGKDGYVLERGVTYALPLQEVLALDDSVRVRANPKSSIGRIDLSTKVVGDGYDVFDELPPGFNGSLYALVTPLSFPVRIRPGDSLSQLMFIVGDAKLDELALRQLQRQTPIVYGVDQEPVDRDALHIVDNGTVLFGADLGGDAIAYRARHAALGVLDLQRRDHDPDVFFKREGKPESWNDFYARPGEFYLLATAERIAVPFGDATSYAVTMPPFIPGCGDMRSHYAGFFDTGWGFSDDGSVKGKPGTLEVRGMDTGQVFRRGQAVAGFYFERMREKPDKVYSAKTGAHYAGEHRGPQPSKHFSKHGE